jgi:16S rRNA (uracil1498-N3)-methyltransferase
MSNLRFFSPDSLHIGTTLKLSENAAIHATRVMRLNVGDSLNLFCGDGFDYHCELLSIKKSEVLVNVINRIHVENESNLYIHLLQGISSGDRMDIALQKAVELGVSYITPIKSERSVVKLDEEKAKKRVEHWQNIVIATCEQSGRSIIPQVATPITLALWLAENPAKSNTRITLDPLAIGKIKDLPKPRAEIELLIGAEGGLSTNEILLARLHGFIGAQLGGRILRTETAPLAAIATMQTLWGDF